MNSVFEYLRRLWIRKSLFLLFLKSYIPIIAIMLVFSIFSYFVAIWQINDNVKKLNLSLMNNISSVIDQRLAEIERTSHRLNSLGTTMKLAYMEESNQEFYYEMTRYVQNLWTLWLENDSLTPRMYIYFARSGILAAPDTFYKTEDFYNRFFTYDNMKPDDFFNMLVEEENNFRYLPARPINLLDQPDLQGTFDMVIYNYQLKQVSGSTAPGSIFFLIDTREIAKMMEVLEIGEGGLAVIMNRDGKIVSKLDNRSGISEVQILEIAGGNTEILEDRMVITSLSDKNGWKYLALGSRDVLMKPVMVLRQVLAFLFILSVLLASALSLWMARKRSLPLFDLVCRLNAGRYPEPDKPEETGTGYRSLEISVNSMLQQNVHMQEQLETIHPMLLPAFLHRLFGGGFADDREVADAAGQIGIVVPLPPYRLISFIIAPPAD
ncbi:MAG: cache domain-containing protein, partial [Saccharofermentanales bacterium]